MTTLLHLSDTQFGQHHRFGVGDDSLAESLLSDLHRLTDDVPNPDVVVVSGDLTEHGEDEEFSEAEVFIRCLLGELGLTEDRLVLVPGNHDVNWELCKQYFASTNEPKLPCVPKWEPYARFRSRIYPKGETDVPFLERPYELRCFDALRLRVIALNSTMRETHLQHYGWCGATQLKWFANELSVGAQASEQRGYWTVAVLHHHVREKDILDTERLHDYADLTRLLGPYMDVVLHGHTHDGKSEMLADGTPVLATGSAAVDGPRRPEEVPNQYQVLEMGHGAVRRWARRYEPGQKRWVGDTSLSGRGDVWWEDIQLRGAFDSAAATLAATRNHLRWLGVAAKQGDDERFQVEKYYLGEDVGRLKTLVSRLDAICSVHERADSPSAQHELVEHAIGSLEPDLGLR